MTSLQPGNTVSMAAGRSDRSAKAMLLGLVALAVALFPESLRAAGFCRSEGEAVDSAVVQYVSDSLTKFHVPGGAVGIVRDDKISYVLCGERSKSSGKLIGADTVFQIGSLTKGFLATTMAIMVDRGKMKWSDRVALHDPKFALGDRRMREELQMSDLLAQRSGLPPYANDMVGTLGASQDEMIASLFYVEPDQRPWVDYSYVNIPQMEAARIVAKLDGLPDWNAVLQKEVLAGDKLDMPNSSYTAAAIEAAPDHAVGHVWTPEAASPVDFSPIFPYGFGAAGDINTTARSLVKWLRLQINDGKIPETDRYLVSAENLDKTRQIQVQIKDYLYYALGWMVLNVPYDRHKSIVLHDGSTLSFGSFAGWWQGTKTGVVILTNAQEKGLPSALGLWILEKLDGRTPPAGDKDYVEVALNKAKENYQHELDLFERPKDPLPTSLDGWDGEFANSSFGKADLRREKALRSEDDTLILKLATGAELELKPWSGDKLTESLVATGDFEALAKNLGALPLGFATLVSGAAGAKRDLLLELDGQSYQFQR